MRKQALVLAGLIIVGSATDVPASSPCSNGIVIPEPEKHPALVEDCEALLAVRDQLDLQIWPAEGSWTVDNPITEWFGVTVEEYRVRKLELHSAYEFHEVTMQGHLPSELGELTALTDLALTHDGIEGEIPPEVANLTNLLSLVLYGSMTGRIPAEIGELTQLMELYLGGHLTGTIPPELGKLTQLVGLGISGTNLTGQIPPALFNLRQLKRLYLNDNSLTGPIPPELFTNLRSLTELNLGNWSQGQNRWTGPIPPEIGRLHELSSLRIQNAGLTGAIPPEIGDLSRLVYLYLDHNELSGSIPPEVGRLRGLSNLYLNDNQLSLIHI